MSWRDQLREGRFRGVPFLVESAETTLGRRQAVHEFPGREVPYVEDLGRAASEFSLELFVLGADYMAARDQLWSALLTPGPGILVHPYLGTLTVVVRDQVRVRETTAEGGKATFSVRMVEAGQNPWPIVQSVPEGAAASRNAVQAQVAVELDALALDALPVWQREQLSQSFAVELGLTVDLEDGWRVALALLNGAGALRPWPPTLVSAPLPGLVLLVLAWDLTIVAGVKLTRLKTADEANAVRDELLERLEALETWDTNASISDELGSALQQMRRELVADIRERLAALPKQQWLTPESTLPCLVHAWQAYGDLTRESELLVRNGVEHPGFVPAGVRVEVLRD